MEWVKFEIVILLISDIYYLLNLCKMIVLIIRDIQRLTNEKSYFH